MLERRLFMMGAISLCAMVCVGVAQDADKWLTQGTPEQLTFGAGNDTEASVDADGRIAYQSDVHGGSRIFVLENGAPRQITGGGRERYAASAPLDARVRLL